MAANAANTAKTTSRPEKFRLDRAKTVRAKSLSDVRTEMTAKTILPPVFSSLNWKDSDPASTDFTTVKASNSSKPRNRYTSWNLNSRLRVTDASGGSGLVADGGWGFVRRSVRILDLLSSTQTFPVLIRKNNVGRRPETKTT